MTTILEKERIAYTEVIYILNLIDEEYYNKIPRKIIELFQKNVIQYYQYYDKNGKIKMSDLTKKILCYLNLEFWCDEKEKNLLIKKYKNNDEIIKNKYDMSKIFENRKNKPYGNIKNKPKGELK